MATAKQCRAALERLAGRLFQVDAALLRTHLADRTLSCHVRDLDVTFVTRIGPHSADPIVEGGDGQPAAQIRFTATSDDVLAIAGEPGSFGRAWVAGQLTVEGSFFDLLLLRRLAQRHQKVSGP